jgi:hypothetical protein
MPNVNDPQIRPNRSDGDELVQLNITMGARVKAGDCLDGVVRDVVQFTASNR